MSDAVQRVKMILVLIGVSVLTACSGPSTAEPTPSIASPAASPVSPTALPAPTTPSPTPTTTANASPSTATQSVWVANTEGGGVYLRNSPHDGDRGQVLPEGTQLLVKSDAEVEGDGQNWYTVQTVDDGTEGYVPVIYTARTKPDVQPGAAQGAPK